jgi:hypothetical protein
MPTADELMQELDAHKDKLVQARADAGSDSEALTRIDAAIEAVDAARAELALGQLAAVAAKIESVRASIKEATAKAAAWPSGSLG